MPDSQITPEIMPALPLLSASATKNLEARAGEISNELCLQLRKDGWSLAQIAEKFGISWQSVQKRLGTIASWVGQISTCEPYKKHRADVLATIQHQALGHMTPEKLEACSAPQLMMVAGIAYDKERLERGMSTEIVDTRALTCDIVELDRRIAEKEAAMRAAE